MFPVRELCLNKRFSKFSDRQLPLTSCGTIVRVALVWRLPATAKSSEDRHGSSGRTGSITVQLVLRRQ